MLYEDCDLGYPSWYLLPHMFVAITFVCLFANFYVVSYMRKSHKHSKDS